MDEKTQGQKTGKAGSTPPMRKNTRPDAPKGRSDHHKVGETADETAPDADARDEPRKKRPEESEIERAQEDETNMGHPERPYT